jgi:hypothetical protein
MSNRRKPKKPWLALGEAGTVAKFITYRIPNRRRIKGLKRRINVNTMILEGKMVAPSDRP